jgi:hypothetical protein
MPITCRRRTTGSLDPHSPRQKQLKHEKGAFLPSAFRAAVKSDRFQVLNERAFLFIRQLEIQVVVIVIDNLLQCGKPPIVVETILISR